MEDGNLVIYNILNVIIHKKFRKASDYELERLEETLPRITDKKLFNYLIDIIKQIRSNNIDSFSINNILDYLKSKNVSSALVEIPVSSTKIEKNKSNRIPRLDYYFLDDYTKLFGDAKILKSIFIEESEVNEPYYMVDDSLLKILVPYNYEMQEILVRIMADATDSVYIPLTLFIRNFDLLKSDRGYFRYVSVYATRGVDKDIEKLSRKLYESFKYGNI